MCAVRNLGRILKQCHHWQTTQWCFSVEKKLARCHWPHRPWPPPSFPWWFRHCFGYCWDSFEAINRSLLLHHHVWTNLATFMQRQVDFRQQLGWWQKADKKRRTKEKVSLEPAPFQNTLSCPFIFILFVFF